MGKMANRTTIYRFIPGSKEKTKSLYALSGACRWTWNYFLNKYRLDRESCDKPNISFYSRCNEFTDLRRNIDWLQKYSCAIVRNELRKQEIAFKEFFKGNKGYPKTRKRYGKNGFTCLKNRFRIQNNELYIQKLGWFDIRRRNTDPYEGYNPVEVTVKEDCGKWYAHVVYEVPEEDLNITDNDEVIGIDRNIGQVTLTKGNAVKVFELPERLKRLEKRKKHYQRMMARRQKGSNRRFKAKRLHQKTCRNIRQIRHNFNHHVSRFVANKAGTVVLEDLKTSNMTRSAKGTVENTGKNVKQKAGLNRKILNTGWHQLETLLNYKVKEVVKVDPKFTSQTCYECGYRNKKNRKGRSFLCRECGHSDNADLNAALNIRASGIGVTGRGGLGQSPPEKRQIAFGGTP